MTGPRLPFAAGLWSLLMAAMGAWWLLVPGHYAAVPSATANDSLIGLLDPTVVSGLLVALGLVGALAVAVGTRGARTAPARWVIAPAAAVVLVFGLLVPDIRLLIGLGYSSVLLGIPGALAFTLVLAVRHSTFRWVGAGALACGAIAVVALGVDGPALAQVGGMLGGRLPAFLGNLAFPLLAFGGALLWVGVGLRASGVRVMGAEPRPWTRPPRDLGWWVTLAALACPLLFGLQRLSWATPWPLTGDPDALVAEPGMRIFGIGLGVAALAAAALAAAALTSGLIIRWGSVYPQWLPKLGGRPVSPVWPSVTAATIGLVVTIAGRSMAQQVLTLPAEDRSALGLGLAALSIPWGPLLVAAAVAHFRRRATHPQSIG